MPTQTVLHIQNFHPILFGCYTNAAIYVTKFDPTAKYVEGIARHTFLGGQTVDVEHGWAQDSQGRVVEVTWLERDYVSTVYIPKKFKTRSQLMRTKTWQRWLAIWETKIKKTKKPFEASLNGITVTEINRGLNDKAVGA